LLNDRKLLLLLL